MLSSAGTQIGTLEHVLQVPELDVFDGIVIKTQWGERFVDAPEVARIAERAVTLSIRASDAAELPEHERGAPEFQANPGAGRVARFFGGSWRRR